MMSRVDPRQERAWAHHAHQCYYTRDLQNLQQLFYTYAENKDRINERKRILYAEKPIISDRKFTEYALNPTTQPDKAEAFRLALGYTKENYESLREQIRNQFNLDLLREKGDNGYGIKYEQVMEIKGPNGKTANVCTGWIKKNGQKRLTMTSAYVTEKKVSK